MMQMTESEICFRFRRNGCKRKHIQILAELNAVEPEGIEEILAKNGFYNAANTVKTMRNQGRTCDII